MSQGNLKGKLVAFDFWPSCRNCQLYEECRLRPRHPAFPHSWHWGREFAAFADGYLIIHSWVGTAAIGQPHTSCNSYQVDSGHVSEPQIHHRLYLDLEHEKGQLEAEMGKLERQQVWSKNAEDFHASLLQRYRRILEQQDTLRSVVDDARPLPAVVNG
jgi:hypothetical protein